MRKKPLLAEAARLESRTPRRITPLRCRRSLFAFVGPRSILVRARCSHEASPCLCRACTPCGERLRDASMEAKTRTSNFCRTFFDARAHPQELSILLRARLAASVRVQPCRPGFRRAVAFASGFMTARARSHALCDPRLRPISRPSLSRSSLSRAVVVSRRRPNMIEPGECRSMPGLAGTRHGSRSRSEGPCWRFPPA